MQEVAVPVGRVGAEAAVEALAHAFVGILVAAAAVDLEQLQVGERAAAAGVAQAGRVGAPGVGR